MFSSLAKSHVRLNYLQNLDLSLFTVETEYQEFAANTSFSDSYSFALSTRVPSVRTFILKIPVLRYYFDSFGAIDITYNKDTNMAWVEWMYNVHKLHKPFLFTHPVYGVVKVRFKEALRVPKGVAGGQACVEALELQLVETSNPKPLANFTPQYTDLLFDFPYHLVSTEYKPEGLAVPLGGNYAYTVTGNKPEQRKFTLYFKGFRYIQDGLNLRTDEDAQLNMARLEMFYNLHKLDKPFDYNHPVFGMTKVRFDQPLKVPAGLQNSNWTGDLQLNLIEVVTDASRYY